MLILAAPFVLLILLRLKFGDCPSGYEPRKASAVPEYVTETREGMDNIADAIRTLAGVMASLAAGMHTDKLGDQRNMAGVIFADATARFSDILRKLDDKKQAELERYIDALCKGKR